MLLGFVREVSVMIPLKKNFTQWKTLGEHSGCLVIVCKPVQGGESK